MSTETPQETESVDPQTRLLRMLESVRLDKEVAEDDSSEPAGCPHCGSLESWGTASWCPDCGYYPKLGRAVAAADVEGDEDEPTFFSEVAGPWIIWLSVGLLLILAESIAMAWLLPDLAQRGAWGRLQLLIGLAILAVGQAKAYLIATQNTDTVPLNAFFFEPFKLWTATCKKLPGSRRTLYLGSWGSMLVVLAIFVIGLDVAGLFADVPRRKVGLNPIKAIVQIASASEGSQLPDDAQGMDPLGDAMTTASEGAAGVASNASGSLEDAVESLAGTGAQHAVAAGGSTGRTANGNSASSGTFDGSTVAATAEEPIPLTPDGEVREDRDDFYAFGYLTNAAGELRSILVADVNQSRGRFVGKISVDDLDPAAFSSLQSTLEGLRCPRPALLTPYRAHWVFPVIKVQVAFDGWTPDRHVRHGYVMTFEDTTKSTPPQSKKNAAASPAQQTAASITP